MRIVLDTNILARATPGRDSPASEVLLRSLQPPHILLVSDYLLDELSRVLRYERLRRIHGLSEEAIDAYTAFIRKGSQPIELPSSLPQAIVKSDPEDDPILATAIIGVAQVLATLDRDLRRPAVVEYAVERGVRIMTDVELLDELRQIPNAEPND